MGDQSPGAGDGDALLLAAGQIAGSRGMFRQPGTFSRARRGALRAASAGMFPEPCFHADGGTFSSAVCAENKLRKLGNTMPHAAGRTFRMSGSACRGQGLPSKTATSPRRWFQRVLQSSSVILPEAGGPIRQDDLAGMNVERKTPSRAVEKPPSCLGGGGGGGATFS